MTTVQRTMTTHPALIFDIIKSQAGSRGKAVAELGQNSVDASAGMDAQHQWFEVTLTSTGFTARDAGRGFASRQEIEDNFLVFGQPHTEGDSVFGRFRLGRGQIMAFARTRWRTTTFAMHVDIKERGLQVDIDENLPFQPGCVIEGQWYEPLLPSDLYSLEQEIMGLFAYAPMPMRLNGKQINKLPQSQQWDAETEEAYFKFRESGGLILYNLGFLVRTFPGFQHGNAIVVSKKHLELNMARNDVLVSSCKVWRKIVRELSNHLSQQTAKSQKMTEDVRQNLAQQWRFGGLSYSQICEAKLVTDVQGAHHTIDRFTNAEIAILAPKGNRLAETVHRRKVAFVVAEITLSRFGVNSLEEFRTLLCELANRDRFFGLTQRLQAIHLSDLSIVSQGMESGYILHTDQELNQDERILVGTLNRYQWVLVQNLNVRDVFPTTLKPRTIRAGSSDSALGWTDGTSYIAIHRQVLQLAIKKGYPGMVQLLMLLLHEYEHDSQDLQTHEHNFDFYEVFHNAVMWGLENSIGLFELARVFFDTFHKRREQAGKKPRQVTLRDQDRMVKSGPAPIDVDDELTETQGLG